MNHSFYKRICFSLAVFAFALFAVAVLSMGRVGNSTAKAALSPARTVSTSVNIVNNSNRAISNVYLSHVDADDWSSDQLSADSEILPSQSFSLASIACDQQQVRVIGEDADGCFVSTVVNCGDSATWTISNDTARDCGN